MRVLLACLFAAPLWAQAQLGPWQMEPSETTADLRGIHAVGGGVVWASGTGGTVLRSQDSGFEWQQCATPPGAEKLDFRAIWAWDDQTALVLSSGPGTGSRLYKTTDGCAHWSLLRTNADPKGFWDALVFEQGDFGLLGGKDAGLLLGDPVGGRFFAAGTVGASGWLAPQDACPSVAGEGAFAASNSSAVVLGWRRFLFGTGGKGGPRVLLSPLLAYGDANKPCRSVAVPLASGADTAGIFSLAARDKNAMVAVGGDYSKPDERAGSAAWTADGGLHWAASATLPGGYRSAVGWDAELGVWVAAGPNGSDLSHDNGRTWEPIEHAPAGTARGGEWNALSLPWAVGPHGRIGKLNLGALGTRGF